MSSEEPKIKISEIRKKLEAEEAHLLNALREDAGDIEELRSDWQERDSPAERNLRAVEWSQYSSLQDSLTEIREAKERIEQGTYGTCEDCEEDIQPKRLLAVPTASKCLSCQDKADRDSELGKATL